MTKPVGLIEELVAVGIPVYGSEILPDEQSHALLSTTPSAQTRTDQEVRETLEDLFSRPGLDAIIDQAVEKRRSQVAAERREWRERLEKEDGSASVWLNGVDDLIVASVDLLAATVLYPE